MRNGKLNQHTNVRGSIFHFNEWLRSTKMHKLIFLSSPSTSLRPSYHASNYHVVVKHWLLSNVFNIWSHFSYNFSFINDKTNNEVMNVTGLHRGLEEKFDLFCSATTFESILACFYELCDGVVSKPTKQSWNIFHELSVNLKSYWKAAALFSKLEKRVKMKQYHHQTLCRDINVSSWRWCN